MDAAFSGDFGFDDLGVESFHLRDLGDEFPSFDGEGDLGDVGPYIHVN